MFVGLSVANVLDASDVSAMNTDAIVLAIANPVPEIMPEEARRGGAKVIGTGRSDLPNQINNVLAFPGVLRGTLDVRAARITTSMKTAAAAAIAGLIATSTADEIIPHTLDSRVVPAVADAVGRAWQAEVSS